MAVEFLECAAVELAGRDVAGDGQKRDRIEKGIAQRDRQIGRARTAGREGRDRPAGDAVIDIGHEARHGLMVHRDGLDVGGALMQRIDEADIAMPAQAEHVGHALAHEIIDNDLPAVEDV